MQVASQDRVARSMHDKTAILLRQEKSKRKFDRFNYQVKKELKRADMISVLCSYYERVQEAKVKIDNGHIAFQRQVDLFEREIICLEKNWP